MVVLSSFTYGQDYAKGKQLFNTHCAACHKMDKKLVGPPLQDVIELQGAEWTKKWIYNSKALKKKVDKKLKEFKKDLNKRLKDLK